MLSDRFKLMQITTQVVWGELRQGELGVLVKVLDNVAKEEVSLIVTEAQLREGAYGNSGEALCQIQDALEAISQERGRRLEGGGIYRGPLGVLIPERGH